ncbi:MAG: formate--tetrahydrofolate ligase [Christensenellaceae bacterium]|jgi:formate--tetrahydrofolate ligase|nr:formate--tetrahydrofolate ligase [Christensenellaceae bacterium]
MGDIEIARNTQLSEISAVATKLGIANDFLEPYGKYKAKITLEPNKNPTGKLILVTAVNPTPFGEGKTTISIGLADAIARLGESVSLALREPSLGPVFGIKGGATGGGFAQVAPMEDINLHFTGDFHAITTANNFLSSLIDNHIKHGNALELDTNQIEWRRCLDLNDRALREIRCGLGSKVNGPPRDDGFNITAASEIMSALCLSDDLADLKRRLGNIVIGQNINGKLIKASALNAENAMTILLKNAIFPNLVQTLEGTPAIIHGGPFANIAHGCNSIRATRLSMSLSKFTVTEAGFGADLGAEKFLDIKCRVSGLSPDAVVLVATTRALKYNGGYVKGSTSDGMQELKNGLKNLKGHIDNLLNIFSVKLVVAINRFSDDTDAQIKTIKDFVSLAGIKCFTSECWALGGLGCLNLATEVISLASTSSSKPLLFAYDLEMTIAEKIEQVATKIYGAKKVVFSEISLEKLARLNQSEYAIFPICIAKTQYSFSQDPKLLGRPSGFEFFIRDIQLRAGAGFIVAIAGDIMLMPGLPANPAAINMTIDEKGIISGLF